MPLVGCQTVTVKGRDPAIPKVSVLGPSTNLAKTDQPPISQFLQCSAKDEFWFLNVVRHKSVLYVIICACFCLDFETVNCELLFPEGLRGL